MVANNSEEVLFPRAMQPEGWMLRHLIDRTACNRDQYQAGSRWKRAPRWTLALAATLLLQALAVSAPGVAQAIDGEAPRAAEELAEAGRQWSRHHVLFIIDSSGSFFEGGVNRRRLIQRALEIDLGELLRDGKRNGFQTEVYDSAIDQSTAMAFGMAKEFPFLRHNSQRGFFRKLWVQEKGKTLSDLAYALPTDYRYWTASTVANSMAVPQLRWELERAGREPEAFERTFLVLVTDDELNASGLHGELRSIRGAIDRESERQLAAIDHAEAGRVFDRLTELYAFQATAEPTVIRDDFEGFSGFVIGPRIKVRIRELKPLRVDGIDTLLSSRPDRVTELARDGKRYSARLRLEPARFDDVAWSYELLGVDVRMPGWRDFRPLHGWSPDRIELPWVEIAREDIP